MIPFNSILLISFKNSNIDALRVQFHPAGQEFPGPLNGLPFKIVAKGPVPQHLEHGMMVGIMTHLFQIVVFPCNPQAFLGVRNPPGVGLAVPQEDVLKGIHSRIGEHEGGIVF